MGPDHRGPESKSKWKWQIWRSNKHCVACVQWGTESRDPGQQPLSLFNHSTSQVQPPAFRQPSQNLAWQHLETIPGDLLKNGPRNYSGLVFYMIKWFWGGETSTSSQLRGALVQCVWHKLHITPGLYPVSAIIVLERIKCWKAMSTNPDFLFYFFTWDWKTQIHRLHTLTNSSSPVMSEFFHSISHKQLKKKSCIPACAVNHPTKLEVAQYLFWILPCAQKGPVSVSGSCLVGSATHTVPAFQERVERNKHTSKMSAAAPLPQQIKDWWEQLVLRVHRSGMEEKLPPCYGLWWTGRLWDE